MQSNRNVKRKQRCLLFAKTQQMYSKNIDGEDITKEIKEMPIDLLKCIQVISCILILIVVMYIVMYIYIYIYIYI